MKMQTVRLSKTITIVSRRAAPRLHRFCDTSKTNAVKRCFLLLLLLFWARLSTEAQRTTVVVSLDGFRWDYCEMYDTPHLDRLGAAGVKAVMQPSFPSKTFPNHYTLVTGLVPDHHGIISNSFVDKATGLTFSLSDKTTKQDPRFWGGEPVWLTAQRQGRRAATVYWPGSDVAIRGQYPWRYENYEQKPLLSFAQRIAKVEQFLQLPPEERPALILTYFEFPDHQGHLYGPASPETRRTVETMDGLVGQLYDDIRRLPHADSINLIVTADHGMTALSPQRVVNIEAALDTAWLERIHYDLPVHLFVKPGCEQKVLAALSRLDHLRAWRKADIPAYLRYGTNANIGDIVVLADMGWHIGTTPSRHGGTHGFDPTGGDMWAIFRAAGPDFRRGYVRSEVFQNTAVYGLLCRLLGIRPAPNDGRDNLNDLLVN